MNEVSLNAKTSSKQAAVSSKIVGMNAGMSDMEFARGDRVRWSSPQGEISGTVKRKITAATSIKGHRIAASPANPEYVVETDRTGARAAHKPGALRKET